MHPTGLALLNDPADECFIPRVANVLPEKEDESGDPSSRKDEQAEPLLRQRAAGKEVGEDGRAHAAPPIFTSR